MGAQAKEPSGTTEPTRLSLFPKPTPSSKVRLMKNHTLGLCLLLLPFFSACEKMADVNSPQFYSKDGLSFSFPGNWKITEEEIFEALGEKTKIINVESPGDAIVIICAYGFEVDQTLKEFAKEFTENMKGEIPLGKVGESRFSGIKREGKTGQMQGLRNKLEMTFVGESIPHVQEFFALKKQGKTAFIVCQSAEEDLKKTEPAFGQIVGSFELE
jgi:hypothetical protein